MFKPATIKALSIIAIILTSIGMALSILSAIKLNGIYYVGCLSWGLLLWASIIGLQLSGYKLYDDEYKKVTIRICLVIVAFFVALFTGLLIGVILAIALLATLWGFKRNYDEWDNNSIPPDEGSANI
jgi:hypothetical protein